MTAYPTGSVWFMRAAGNTVTGPGHVVVDRSGDRVKLIKTVGGDLWVHVAELERHFLQVPALVEDDLTYAEGEARDLEQRAKDIRAAIAAVRKGTPAS